MAKCSGQSRSGSSSRSRGLIRDSNDDINPASIIYTYISHDLRPSTPHFKTHSIANLKLPTKLLLFTLTILSSTLLYQSATNPTTTMASLFQRLTRPFTSSTMRFAPDSNASAGTGGATTMSVPEGAEKATIAAGCFWGVEHLYRHHFAKDAITDLRVGYIGGDSSNPSYRAVCTGRTGHAEALQMTFDPAKVSYGTLLEFLYKMHDPTTKDRQGPDTGSQYRSGIFYHDEEQEKTAREVTRKVQEQWWKNGKIVTEILPAGQWWDAEDYHQKYLDVNPGGYECPSHFLRKFPALQ